MKLVWLQMSDSREAVEYLPVSRFFRVLFCVVISILPALTIASLLWSEAEGHYTHVAAMPLFLVGFLSPVFALFAVGVSSLLYWLDVTASRKGGLTPRQSFVLVLALVAGVFTGYVSLLLGAFFLLLLFYWVLTGRVAGKPGWSIRYFWQTRWDEKIYLLVMSTLLLVGIGKGVSQLAYADLPARPGTPAFSVKYDHQMHSGVKRAMRRFPDRQSCLKPGADASKRQDLVKMDWDRIATTSEAEVCIFRLLHGWGGVVDAAEWLEAQGFRVEESFSSQSPYVDIDGSLRVVGGWSIKQKGPRFPTSGVIRRILHAVPYGMNVNATYGSDGRELLFLKIDASTL